MPEMPEVETVRRVLADQLAGLPIEEIVVRRPTFYRPPPKAALDGLIGRKVTGFSRRGKFLSLESGERSLVFHLGMSGRLYLTGRPAGNHAVPHCRFEMGFKGKTLRFIDPRRFGRVGCPLPRFGPEALGPEFTPQSLRASLRGRGAAIKALLMDQRIVAGLGNIYATESLFRAGVRPGRAGGSLTAVEILRLHGAIVAALGEGVRLGGSTLDDEAFLDPLGRPGRFQKEVAVYGRKIGACGHPLRKTRKPIASRSAAYCPVCQR